MKFKLLLRILYQPYKWFFFIPFLMVNTLIFAAIAVMVAILTSPQKASIIGVLWARVNAFFTPLFTEIKGTENISPNTSYIIVANHQSYYDIFLMYGWLGIDFKWVMKKELRKVPALGIACEKIGHIFLERSNSKEALDTLNETKKKLVNGTSVVMFPEGTRSKGNVLNPFKKGAFKLAWDLELPILPITLIGTGNILPPDSLNIFPGKVTMIIHEPISYAVYKNNDMHVLMNEVRKKIEKPLLELKQ
jgi:1-acyl-sn-glycerol-3-phosphate acyltransferase